jgi:hypothetical protein
MFDFRGRNQTNSNADATARAGRGFSSLPAMAPEAPMAKFTDFFFNHQIFGRSIAVKRTV